ncbi:MAG: DUF4412 domain-containing protein [Dehalococcoidia bacterium]
MKRLIILAMVLMLALSCVSIVACGGGGDDDTGQSEQDEMPTAAPASEGETPTAEATEEGSSGEGELEKIFENVASKAGEIRCVHYVARQTYPGQQDSEYEFWMNEAGKVRMEGSVSGQEESVMIMDDESMIVYTPQTGDAMKFSMGSTEAPDIPFDEDPVEEIESITGFGYTIKGEERINGMDCIVVDYSDMNVETTVWIWKDHGFPVKTVVETDMGTMTTEFTQIDFDCPPESTFQLPAGVEVMDLEEMMNQYGGGMGDGDIGDIMEGLE